MFSKHPEWPVVKFILETLHQKGHQAVLAGGCVRDALIGKMAKDLDVATDATPDQVESYFERVLPLGKSFGVCRVIHEGQSIEVATFRQEFDYQDGRRPNRVEYSTIDKDAERRDFTINALYYDTATGQVIDFVGGREDLQKKQLRSVGKAERRFAEDYLRILRGVRFAGQLNFHLEHDTYTHLKKLTPFLARISRERIYDELNKMFVPYGIYRCYQILEDIDFLSLIFEDWRALAQVNFPHKSKTLNSCFLELSQKLFDESVYGWVLLYHVRSQQVGVKAAEKELSELKVPRQKIDACKIIIEASRIVEGEGDQALAAFIELCASGFVDLAQQYWSALDDSGQWTSTFLSFKDQYFIQGKLPEALVTGHDLIQIKMIPGPSMKEKLKTLYRYQLKNKELNKEDLLKIAVSL